MNLELIFRLIFSLNASFEFKDFFFLNLEFSGNL